jgi:hypothetical protein
VGPTRNVRATNGDEIIPFELHQTYNRCDTEELGPFSLLVTMHVRVCSYDCLFYHFRERCSHIQQWRKYTDEGNFSKKRMNPSYAIVHGAKFRRVGTTSFEAWM